ncbi:MAG: transporter substrate-binding domain-containing protein [Nitrospirae bacterium]|nr:transporter substrate-binding domain-containing protein [Nitrospirota bacterium]
MYYTKIVRFLTAFAALILISASSADAGAKEEKIRVKAVAAVFDPFVRSTKSGLSGFDIDLFDIICRTNNLECEIEVVQFRELLPLVSQGKADLALGSIYVNSERKKLLNFSDSYFSSGLVKVKRVSESEPLGRFDKVAVGVKKGATGQAYAAKLRKKYPSLSIEMFDSTEESFHALADKKVDFVLNDFLNSQALINKNYRGVLTVKIGLTGPDFFEKNTIAFPISKSRPELLKIFNVSLAEMSAGGTLDRLKEKWLMGVESRETEKIKVAALSIFSIFIIMLLVSQHMRRCKINKALAENEHRYRMLFEANPLALIIYSVDDYKIIAANQSAAKLYSCTRDDLKVLTILDLFLPEERERLAKKISDLRSDGNKDDSYSGEWRVSGRNNTAYIFEIASQPIRYDSTNARLAMMIDITERKKAEIEIQNSELRFRSAIENAPNAIFILSREGRILFINRMASQTLLHNTDTSGKFIDICSSAFKINKNCTDFVDSLITSAKTLEGNIEFNEISLTHPDYTDHIWNFQLSSIGKWGDQEAIMVIAKDITEQKKLQQEQIHSQRLETIGRLTGGIAHDFNNYLTAIIGYTQLALDQTPKDSALNKNLGSILSAANKSAALTKQLLAFGRKQVLQIQQLDINTIVTDLSKIFMPLISSGIELKLALSPELWRINADHSQLEQVIMNLVINARDSMPRGGRITIRTANRMADKDFRTKYPSLGLDQYVCLDIRDSGTGMTNEVKSRVFEPFFTTKEFGKGTGLGLATAYGIIKQSGGEIFVFSSPNNGTLFRIFFPKASETAEITDAEKELGKLPLGTEGVLVVENQQDVRLYLLNILQILGYQTFEAKDGAEALIIMQEHSSNIQLVLVELNLPKIDGEAIAGYIENSYPEVKIALMSGSSKSISKENSRYSFIKKPFTASQLASTARELLDSKKTGD